MNLSYAFNAFDKRHMPLDEMTAPYTVTNFTSVMEFVSSATMDKVCVVCPRVWQDNSWSFEGPITDYIAMLFDGAETIDGTIPPLQELRSPIINTPALTSEAQHFSVRARLHNMSVQFECLGTNTGLYPPGSAYIGTVPTIETGTYSQGQADLINIKTAWADDAISVGYLKSFTAKALSDAPVVLHSAVSENVSYKMWRDFALPTATSNKGSIPFAPSLQPIVIYVPRAGSGTTVVNYKVTVGQQWCSRHPNNIMMRSTQKQHHATEPGLWNRAVQGVKEVGHIVLQNAGNALISAVQQRAQAAYQQAIPLVD